MNGFIPLDSSKECFETLLEDEFPTNLFLIKEKKAFNSSDYNYLIYIIEGDLEFICQQGKFLLKEGMYLNYSEEFEAIASGKTLVIAQRNYKGLFSIGGPIENKGRLKYIDGCSDTLLIAPDILGSPCFNLLHIPKNTNQTAHTHPSYRVGVIVSGHGICKTPTEDFDLYPGMVFIIKKNAFHSFFTAEEELRVVAYHPDSDFGPTHENHPMINKTIIHELS